MKVCFCCAFFWPVVGGAETYAFNLAKTLQKHGEEVEVYTSNIYPDGKKIKRPLLDEYDGIPIRRFPVYFSVGDFAKVWFPKFEKDFDFIHCNGYRHPFSFFAFLRRGRAKYLINPHFPEHPRTSLLQRIEIPIIDRSFGGYLLSKADCVVAVTDIEERWLKSLGAKHTAIIPDCIPCDYLRKHNGKSFREKFDIQGQMIFILARHHPVKHFEDLIQAVAQLKREDVTLVFGGKKTSYTEKCQKLAEELGISDQVKWVGYLDVEEKLEAYAACDLFVLTTEWEAFGIVLLEAMAQRKPVIATKLGGIPYVVPHKVCLYEPANVEQLTEKIKLFLEDEMLRKKIAELGYEKVKNFTCEKVGEKYVELLESLK